MIILYKNIRFIIFLIFLSFCGFSFAQSNSILANLVTEEFQKQGNPGVVSDLLTDNKNLKNQNLPTDISSYVLLNYNKEKAMELIRKNASVITIELKDTYGQNQILDLINSSESFNNLKITTASGKKFMMNDLKIIHYRGIVRGVENSFVALTLTENEISGVISTKEGNFVLGKLENSEEHLYYNDESIGQQLNWACNNEGNAISIKDNYTDITNLGNFNRDVIQKCVNIYYETTYDIYQDKGSIINVVAYVTGLHNQVSTLYLNEGINMPLSEIKVWDITDPYNSNTYSGLWLQFDSNTSTIDANLAQLLTLRLPSAEDTPGGTAYFKGLCGNYENQKLSVSTINNFYYTVPTYSHSAYIITHEFGHSLGSPDTHSCAWNGNNTAIDGCGYGSSGSCSGPIPPSGGGTIMSFCDRIPGVGINFSNGFGPQPGDKIRTTVINATCLDECFYCNEDLYITEDITTDEEYQVSNLIEASSHIWRDVTVVFKADQIILKPGFQASGRLSGNFHALIDPCEIDDFSKQSVENESLSKSIANATIISYPTISPNPTTTFLNVENIQYVDDWKLVDINGKTIDSGKVNNSIQNKIIINTSRLIPGIYYFHSIMKNGELFQKTIMKK